MAALLWFVMALGTYFVVIWFVFSQAGTAPGEGFVALPSAEKVAQATTNFQAAASAIDQLRLEATNLYNLAHDLTLTTDSNLRARTSVVAEVSRLAAQVATFADNHARELRDANRDLQAETAVVRKSLQSLPIEEAKWKATLLSNALWFLLSAALLAALFYYPNVFRMISFASAFVRSFKGFGIELSFSEQDIEKRREVRTRFADAFGGLREQAKDALTLFASQQDLGREVEQVVTRVKAIIAEKARLKAPLVPGGGIPTADLRQLNQIRCTIHVPDIVFDNHLCQLLRYHPTGTGDVGRAWPVHYGMIGRVWRAERSEIQSFDFDGTKAPDAVRKMLVDDYAMTFDQASALNRQYRSFLCLLLRPKLQGAQSPAAGQSQCPVAVLYMDAPTEQLFGNHVREENQNFQELLEVCDSLTLKLTSYRGDLIGKAPLIEVFDV